MSNTVLPAGIPPPSFSSRPPMPVLIRRIIRRDEVERLINFFRLEYCPSQALCYLWRRLYFDSFLPDSERVEVVGVGSPPHLWYLYSPGSDFHRERVFFERVP